MIICHVCSTECEEEQELCPVCGAVLNRPTEAEEPETAEVEEDIIENPTLLASFEDLISAEVFKDVLKENEIPFTCSSEMGDNTIQVMFGGGFVAEDIYVGEDDLEKARQMLEEFNSQEIEFEGEFFDGEDTEDFEEEN